MKNADQSPTYFRRSDQFGYVFSRKNSDSFNKTKRVILSVHFNRGTLIARLELSHSTIHDGRRANIGMGVKMKLKTKLGANPVFSAKAAMCAIKELTILILLFACALSVNASQAYADDLTLLVGQSRALPAAPNEIVRVKGSHFISVRDDKIKIVATGRAPGEAQIIIGSRDYNIFVTGRKNQNLFTALRDAVRTMLGLKIEMLDGRVTVTGQLHRLQDWIAISRIAANFDSPYTFRARIDNDVKARALNYFRNQLLSRNLPMPNLIWSPMAHAIIAQSDENLKNLWGEVLAPFGIARVYEKSAMSLKPLVRVKITIAEVNKSAERKLGVDWPDSVQQQLLPQMITPTLDVKLHALETRGLAQILASPTLLARSGSQASFLAGGEVPVRAATQYYQQVSYKTYGISLKIKPIADYSGRLSIDLTTEISQLDRANSNSVDQIPAFKTDQMTTHFDLPEPRTIILSGLIDNEWSKDTNDLPLLSHLPILGRLFGSEDFRKQRSELLIFVTPSIVNVQDENQKIQIPQLKHWDS